MSSQQVARVRRPETLTSKAYEQLRDAVLAGRLQSGQQYSVVSLAGQLGMSRSPVRSAIERLAAEGLMTQTASGAIVPSPGRHDLLDALAVRAPLEGLAARLAAPQLEPAHIGALQDIHGRFAAAVDIGDTRVARTLDLQFHQLIQSRCGNVCLVEHLDRVQAKVILATYSTAWSSNQRQAVPEHARILGALDEQDGEAAERAAILHLNNLAVRIVVEWKRRGDEPAVAG